jgi:hypothetical protein
LPSSILGRDTKGQVIRVDRINSVPLDPHAVEARAKRAEESAALTAEERMRRAIRDRRVRRANYARNVLLGGWR